MDASEPEVDSSLPQLSNLNSDFSTVEVSVFYNSCSGLVRPVHNIIRVEMQRDLVGTPRRCTVGIFDRFAVVQLYKRLSAVCIVGIFRAPSVTGERVCQLGRLHISAENALFNAYAR